MPNIKPISDLRNYTEVLQDVAVGAPVFLTKHGRGRYAIVDIHSFDGDYPGNRSRCYGYGAIYGNESI